MTVEEWLIFASDCLLELDQDQDLINVEAAEDDLDPHQGEVDVVSLVDDVLDWHVGVEAVIKLYVEDAQGCLHGHVDQKHDDYRELEELVGRKGTVGSLAREAGNTALGIETQAVVDFASVVEHHFKYCLLEVCFVGLAQFLALLIDTVTQPLTLLYELVG